MYREGSAARAALEAQGEVNHYPPCPFPTGAGLLVPECRQTMDRILGAIPKDEATLARRGKKALKDDCMPMAIRAKPEQVNEVWFGDHHQMDCFVLDEEGKAVRPWLTMWYDAASGFPVGWVLCKKPNTRRSSRRSTTRPSIKRAARATASRGWSTWTTARTTAGSCLRRAL